MGEVRSVSATGGAKGVKPQAYDQIPPEVLRELAEHYGKGAAKYGAKNYLKGYEWSKNVAALMRHLEAWRMGEDIDPENGSPHLVAVAWHAFTLELFRLHPERYGQYNDVQPRRIKQSPGQTTVFDYVDTMHVGGSNG